MGVKWLSVAVNQQVLHVYGGGRYGLTQISNPNFYCSSFHCSCCVKFIQQLAFAVTNSLAMKVFVNVVAKYHET
jgi:hypothetical protein